MIAAAALLAVASPSALPVQPAPMAGTLTCQGVRYAIAVQVQPVSRALLSPGPARLRRVTVNGAPLARVDQARLADVLGRMLGTDLFVESCRGRQAVYRFGVVEPGSGRPLPPAGGGPVRLDVVLDGPRLARTTLAHDWSPAP